MAVSAEEMQAELIAEERYHEDRISHIERLFSALSLSIGGVARKTALMRDKGDKLSRTLQEIKDSEKGSVKRSLDNVSECFGGLEDYRQTQIDRLEAKVIKPLLDYESTCRKAREELKTCHLDRNNLIEQQRTLDRTRIRDPANRRKLAQLESNLEKAKFKYSQTSQSVEDYMMALEKKRIQDLKGFLGEYIQANMIFHAKALEMQTIAYQKLHSIDEDEAIEEFSNGLHLRKRGRMNLDLQSHPQLPLATKPSPELSLRSQEQ